MDIFKPLQKSPVHLDKHNIFNEPNKSQLKNPKIENIQWSDTNEQLRMSGHSEHYATIKDKDKEGSVKPISEYDNAARDNPASKSGLYVSFNTGERLPTGLNNDTTAYIYSYATNGETHFLRHSNIDSHFSSPFNEGIRVEQGRSFNHENYDKKITERKVYSSKYLGDSTDDSGGTYLEPYPRGCANSENHIDRHEIGIICPDEIHQCHQSDTGLVDTINSGYIIGKVPSEKQKNCSACKIIFGIMLAAIVVAAAATILAVIMIGNSKEDDKIKCEKYPNVLNGRINATEEVSTTVSVKITCDKGFEADKIDTAICLNTGSWSKIIECKPVDCGEYMPPNHGTVQQSEYGTSFGSSVNVDCKPGFEFTKFSDRSVTCNENGEWEGSPECENLVDLTIDNDTVLIGKTATLSCEFRKIPNWKKIQFTRISRNGESVTIASIENNVDSYKVTETNDRINIIKKTFTHESGTFIVMFESVECSDAFEEPGDVNITCGIVTRDTHTTFRDEKVIRILGKPSKPNLSIPAHLVDGDTESTLFHCETLFSEPNGHVTIESDIGGSFATLLSSSSTGSWPFVLTNSNGESVANVAWIDTVRFDLDNCLYKMEVMFGLKNVSTKWHRKQVRCTAKPSANAIDQTVLTSDSGVVKVLSGNVCNGKSQVPYPYGCNNFIVCDEKDHFNSVREVRACANKACYDEQTQTCSQCSPAKGCPITDIFFYDGRSPSIGGILEIVCIVEDFKGLTDITITRAYGENVSSIKLGVNKNIPDFKTLPDMTYLNGPHGMLSINITFLTCSDKATYRCKPEGLEDVQSDDVIFLDLNCR